MGNPADVQAALEPLATAREQLERALSAGRAGADPIDAIERALVALGEVEREHRALELDRDEGERAERELRETREHLASMVSAMPIILWAVDGHGRITLSEGQGLAALGFVPGQLVGQSVFDVYAHAPDALDGIRRALAGEPHVIALDLGGRTWSTKYFPRTDARGDIVGFTALTQDVTEARRQKLEAEALEQQLRHAQRVESLGVLAGGIAHDFNNLLAVILGSLQLAQRGSELSSKTRSKLDAAERAAVRAAELTHQLLVYAGRSAVTISPVDVDTLVGEMAGLLGTVVSRNASLDLDLHGDLPPVEADASQLRQVVMNLITNASDALHGASGRILLRTGLVDDGTCEEPSRPEGRPPRRIYLEVEDTGSGIDEATRERMFDPFFTTKSQGRGLGLASVQGIVLAHGGKLEVRSVVGQGTTFRLQLPCSARAAGGASPTVRPPPDAEWKRGSGRVLVVDDEDEVRRLVRDILLEAGYEVVEASCGSDAMALDEAGASPFDAAVLDVVMPGMGGRELASRLRARSPALPIVLVSGYDQGDAGPAGSTDGASQFVAKPFSGATLLEALALAQAVPEA